MPGEGIGEEAVLLLRTGSDVVDDERGSISRLAVAHDHDMRADELKGSRSFTASAQASCC